MCYIFLKKYVTFILPPMALGSLEINYLTRTFSPTDAYLPLSMFTKIPYLSLHFLCFTYIIFLSVEFLSTAKLYRRRHPSMDFQNLPLIRRHVKVYALTSLSSLVKTSYLHFFQFNNISVIQNICTMNKNYKSNMYNKKILINH